jgi:alkyl sulfatase BDS1-like metallo-beta-lactamase superfamily hydrolase
MSDPSADMPAAVRNTQADRSLPFSDLRDFDDADRGFIAALEPGTVRNSDGHVVWDSDSYAFLDEDCPPTVDPRSADLRGDRCGGSGAVSSASR